MLSLNMSIEVLHFLLLAVQASRLKVRKVGVNPIFKRRREQGDGYHLLQELRFQPLMFENYTRLNFARFDYLLELVAPIITKCERGGHTVIPPSHRLAMTLRFLAAGDGYATLSLSYRCGVATVRQIVRETMSAIVEVLHRLVVMEPNTEEQWQFVAQSFQKKTGLPHCLGAIDGRLMRIKCPAENSSNFYSYKKFHAVVLMAVVDTEYSFLMADIGAEGSLSDSTVLKRSAFWKRVVKKTLCTPGPRSLPHTTTPLDFFFIGDGGFQLHPQLMKPFRGINLNEKQMVYNYRISKARVVAEQAFGILVSRWRVFEKPLSSNLADADLTIMAAVCLHNLIIRTSKDADEEEYIMSAMNALQQQPAVLHPVRRHPFSSSAARAAATREELLNHLNNEN